MCSRSKASPTKSRRRPASIRWRSACARLHRRARASRSSASRRHDRLAAAAVAESAGAPGRSPASAAASPTCATSRPRTTSRWRWRSRSIRRAGASDVARVVCAHDCGLVVNPDALKNQVEGCIVQTIEPHAARGSDVRSFARDERRLGELSDSAVSGGAGGRRRADQPPDQPLLGAGEAATAPVAAAIANAVFDATGVRLRRVPFTPARVKAALAEGS